MKRVQNWRDYLDNDNQQYREKISKKKKRKNDEDSVAIGVALFITAGYWFTSSTSFANPAVTIARIFTNTFTGISPISTPYFIFGQIIGAVIGLKIFNFLNNKE